MRGISGKHLLDDDTQDLVREFLRGGEKMFVLEPGRIELRLPFSAKDHQWLKQQIEEHFFDNMPREVLRREVVAREALKTRDKIKKRERQFQFPTHITFDNDGSEIYTIIEVDTRDRPALLYDLTRTLASNNIYIASAVIATYGAQVVDTFYVKDMFGLKLHSKPKRDALERRLREAISAGAERARAE